MKYVIALAALVVVFAGHAGADDSQKFSGEVRDARTLAVQAKVERLFVDGDFERAYFIYRNELVPLGDKYAQYMVGYMYETGSGIERSRVEAAAWYKLAAERGTQEFIAVRRQLIRDFDPEDLDRAEIRYRQLRAEYGDLVVLLNLIKRDLGELRRRTGSRLGSDSSPVSVIDTDSGAILSGGDYFGTIRKRIEESLRKLVEVGGLTGVEIDVDKVDVKDLERRVDEVMAGTSD